MQEYWVNSLNLSKREQRLPYLPMSTHVKIKNNIWDDIMMRHYYIDYVNISKIQRF